MQHPEKMTFHPLLTHTFLQPSSRCPLLGDNPAWGAWPDLILPTRVPPPVQTCTPEFCCLASSPLLSASFIRRDLASLSRETLDAVSNAPSARLQVAWRSSWRCTTTKRGRPTTCPSKRGIASRLSTTRECPAVWACNLSLFSALTVEQNQSALMFSSNGPSVKSLLCLLFFAWVLFSHHCYLTF